MLISDCRAHAGSFSYVRLSTSAVRATFLCFFSCPLSFLRHPGPPSLPAPMSAPSVGSAGFLASLLPFCRRHPGIFRFRPQCPRRSPVPPASRRPSLRSVDDTPGSPGRDACVHGDVDDLFPRGGNCYTPVGAPIFGHTDPTADIDSAHSLHSSGPTPVHTAAMLESILARTLMH